MSAQETGSRRRWRATEIQELRKKFFLTQENLANLLDVAQQRVNEWEHGRKHMSPAYCKILGALQLNLEALLGQGGHDMAKFRRLVLQAHGVEITERHIKKASK